MLGACDHWLIIEYNRSVMYLCVTATHRNCLNACHANCDVQSLTTIRCVVQGSKAQPPTVMSDIDNDSRCQYDKMPVTPNTLSSILSHAKHVVKKAAVTQRHRIRKPLNVGRGLCAAEVDTVNT